MITFFPLYYGIRSYDPPGAPGRSQFISPDSLVPDATNVFDYNRYMYASGNPMQYTDPSGHCATDQDGSRTKSDAQCWGLADTISTIWDQHPHYWEQRFKVSNANWQEKVKSLLSPKLPNSGLQFALFVTGSITLWCLVILMAF